MAISVRLRPPTRVQSGPRERKAVEHVALMEQAHEGSADLERQADELLGRSLILGSDSGIYAEVQLDRKRRREQKQAPILVDNGISDEMTGVLVERQLRDLIDAANLTALQEIIYRLHVAGFSGMRIAATLGIKRGTANQRLRTIRRKVKEAYEQGKYAGWYEVYLSEVRRGK